MLLRFIEKSQEVTKRSSKGEENNERMEKSEKREEDVFLKRTRDKDGESLSTMASVKTT